MSTLHAEQEESNLAFTCFHLRSSRTADVCWSNQLFYYLLLIFLLYLMEIFSYAWNMRAKYFVANKIYLLFRFRFVYFSFIVKILITKRYLKVTMFYGGRVTFLCVHLLMKINKILAFKLTYIMAMFNLLFLNWTSLHKKLTQNYFYPQFVCVYTLIHKNEHW